MSYAEVWKVVNERSCTITEKGKIRKPTFFLVFSPLLNNFFNYSAISCFGLPDGKCGKSLCLKPLIVQSRPLTGSVTLIFAFLCVRHLESFQWCCLLWILYCSAWRSGTHRQQSSQHHLREIMMMVNLWSRLEQNINRLLTPIVSRLDLILSRWYGVWNLKSVNIPFFSWAMRLKFLLADNLPHRVDRKWGQTNSVSELGW